ncbi:MAG: heme exporter protein CcmB [Zoogloeaceae bacterium]|jgi:heme exporter protein B|nr:heme exporter protein CcmB [Zoogloeaceae bacterium]
MFSFALHLIARDFRLALRRPMDVASALFFFLIMASLFPLGVSPEPELLRQLAPGILWIGALLSNMLSLPRLFAEDFQDGALEQMALAPYPLFLLAMSKTLAHWLICGIPLAFLSPLLGLQFDLPPDALGILFVSLLLGSLALAGIGAVGAALILGLRNGGILLALLILPLYIPALIFGTSAVDAVTHGLSPLPYLLLLAAFTLGCAVFAPLAAAAALKVSLE